MIASTPPTPAFGMTLGYAHNPLDRMSVRRDDAGFIEGLRSSAQASTLILAGEQVVLRGDSPWFGMAEAAGFGTGQHHAFLGCLEGRPYFASTLASGPAEALTGRADLQFVDLRAIAVQGLVPPADQGALAQAKALMHWHRTHRFCPHCGKPSVMAGAGWRRECPDCGTHHFPRTDPVVIMLAVDGERCLLGRQARFPPLMYSCLAGFVEPGETLEDAVRRELAEESGIATGAVRYLGSQPWPFPASMMIGCLAEAASTEITIDTTELEDARWFSRDEARAMLEGRHPEGLACPTEMAIAHHILQAWVYGEV